MQLNLSNNMIAPLNLIKGQSNTEQQKSFDTSKKVDENLIQK